MSKRIPFNINSELVANVVKNPNKYSKITCLICREKRKELDINVHSENDLTLERVQVLILKNNSIVELTCQNCCNTGFLFIERKEIKTKMLHVFVVDKDSTYPISGYPCFSFVLNKNMYKDQIVSKFDKIRNHFKDLGLTDQTLVFKLN